MKRKGRRIRRLEREVRRLRRQLDGAPAAHVEAPDPVDPHALWRDAVADYSYADPYDADDMWRPGYL